MAETNPYEKRIAALESLVEFLAGEVDHLRHMVYNPVKYNRNGEALAPVAPR